MTETTKSTKLKNEKAGGAKPKDTRVKPRLLKGMRDIDASELRAIRDMIEKISEVYERYGFEPLDTPTFEYTDALGKFLPDTDRPNEGVFSFQDEDEQWVSLRYDLTAPLARHVAEHYDALPKPFRRYQYGYVYRNEKPGPGRFRQFMQFDADTVGTANPAADAEMCMLAADTLEALDIPRGSYVIKVSNRKILDGVMEAIGLGGAENAGRRLTVLRAIDKADKFSLEEIEKLLGPGRKDESGDFTKGADLDKRQIDALVKFVCREQEFWSDLNSLRSQRYVEYDEELHAGDMIFDAKGLFNSWREAAVGSVMGEEGVSELQQIRSLLAEAGYGSRRIKPNSKVIRGLEYYTGPVFEAELTFPAADAEGKPVRFGSVGGGGRYDGLVSRFRAQPVPATGFSLGVSRLYAALQHLGKLKAQGATLGPVVVLVMDKERIGDYQRLTQMLRNAPLFAERPGGPKIRAEMYLGEAGMKAQMKYADKRGSPCVIIQGEDERARGEVTIKDLIAGAKLSTEIEDNAEWREGRPAQVSVPESEMVSYIRSLLARHLKA